MFFQSMSYYLKSCPPKIYPKLSHYIDYLTIQRNQAIAQHPLSGYETSGIELLEKVLADADIQTIRTVTDPFDQYENMISPIIGDLNQIFDPSYKGSIGFGSFVHNVKGQCSEYLIPSAPADPYAIYPIGSNWDVWSTYRPLRMLNIDSHELSFQSYLDAITYKIDPPRFAVFSLDCAALIMQYISYLEATVEQDRLSLPDYLHRFIVYPCLINDALSIWLINQYGQMIRDPDQDTDITKVDFAWVTATNARIGSSYSGALSDVRSLVSLVAKGNVTPPCALSSLIMLDSTSVLSTYLDIVKSVTVPSLRQYTWAEYLRDELYLFLILDIARLYPSLPQFSKMITYLKRDVALLTTSRFWNTIHNTSLSIHVQNSFFRLSDCLHSL